MQVSKKEAVSKARNDELRFSTFETASNEF